MQLCDIGFEIRPERRRGVVARQTRIDRLPNVAVGVRALVVELFDWFSGGRERGHTLRERE